jgi:hypothetical protein
MSIEAMKQALAKFEHLWEIGIDAEYKVELLPEIEALRQAIEQAEYDKLTVKFGESANDYLEDKKKSWDTSDMAHRSGGLSVEQALDGLAETSREIEQTPDDLLRQSEREGWRYAKECEAEIKRLKELAEYRLQLLMKMPKNKPWVGLTDEEIDVAKDVSPPNLGGEYYREDVEKIARAIEQRLRGKNGG